MVQPPLMSVCSTELLKRGSRWEASARWKATPRSLPFASTTPKRAETLADVPTGKAPFGMSTRTEAIGVVMPSKVIARSSPFATPFFILITESAAKAVGIGAAGFLAAALGSAFGAILAGAAGVGLCRKLPAGVVRPVG